MSSYSQPLNTISYSQNSVVHNQHYKPKYIHDQQDDKLNSTMECQSNKLPLNLFLSAAQYNKMIITYGKNRRKNQSQITDGIITSLQYVNDHIFNKEIQKRAKAKLSIQHEEKHSKKTVQHCTCCCCHDFCEQCQNNANKCGRLSHQELRKARSTIDNVIIQARKGHKISINNSKKHMKITNKKRTNESFHAHSNKDQNSQRNNYVSNGIYLNKCQKQKGTDISHLFTQQKKIQGMIKKSQEGTKKAQQQYLQMLNHQIRAHNLSASRVSHYRPKQKSLTKQELALKYWDQIKNEVSNSLKNDHYSKPLKQQLAKYKFTVYDNQATSQRKPTISKQQIQFLREKRGEEAQRQIQHQKRQKRQKSQHIKNNLKSLQKDRLRNIQQTSKHAFQPTAQMIQTAFKNIVQPSTDQILKQNQNNSTKSFNCSGTRKDNKRHYRRQVKAK